MFTIIGGDGKEYGPVSTDQIRGWISAGRADLDTKARAVGSEEWRQLGDYAEFSSPDGAPPVLGVPVGFGEATASATAAPDSAGLGLRFGAALVDGVLKSLCWLPTGAAIWQAFASDIMAGQQPSPSQVMTVMNGAMMKSLPLLLVLAAVQGVLLARRGQSLGKILCGLRIVRLPGNVQAGLVHAFLLRGTTIWVIEQIPVLGGLFWLIDVCFIFGEERRCVHDYIAGTRVVKA
ncbi:MAG: RDD family protein [Verrucomicrobia bacterium]|nr:MAG: RDD family protein [Verrucomicrobiota bacterium]